MRCKSITVEPRPFPRYLRVMAGLVILNGCVMIGITSICFAQRTTLIFGSSKEFITKLTMLTNIVGAAVTLFLVIMVSALFTVYIPVRWRMTRAGLALASWAGRKHVRWRDVIAVRISDTFIEIRTTSKRQHLPLHSCGKNLKKELLEFLNSRLVLEDQPLSYANAAKPKGLSHWLVAVFVIVLGVALCLCYAIAPGTIYGIGSAVVFVVMMWMIARLSHNSGWITVSNKI